MDLQNIANKFSRTTTINDKEYSIKILGGLEGIKMAKRLSKIILPLIGGSLDGLRHDDIIHGAPKSFTQLALTICEQMDEAGVEQIIVDLLQGCRVKGADGMSRDVDINEDFAANYGELIELLEFSLTENFSSFFTANGIQARFMKAISSLAE